MKAIPVVLFTYARPEHLRRTLTCLRENEIPLLYAFSDGARTVELQPQVAKVRDMLRGINWCQVVLCERPSNLGLGRSVLKGVSEVLRQHDKVIVFEDDLICTPGTYEYLCAALERYADDPRVMSVTGWTHPKITPPDVVDQPYFDGRAECWVWGAWARAWRGMSKNAKTLMDHYAQMGGDVYKYGADLVDMAREEEKKNIWAVRFIYWHMVNGGLCLRPPRSMVEHIGFEAGTNFASAQLPWTANRPLQPCPPIPVQWPTPVENESCWRLHQTMCGSRPEPVTLRRRLLRFAQRCRSLQTRIQARLRGGE